jgi:propanol-preferring alcohol dehydrogenase
MVRTTMMRAWAVRRPGPLDGQPVELEARKVPQPGAGELLVRVSVCGVCRTDLHLAEGDLPVHRPDVVPGHEVVGEVVDIGASVSGFSEGDRVGVAWLRRTCGECAFCLRGNENLCPYSRYTGWDEDGGYAEFVSVPADYAYRLPDGYADEELAPLLCAGIIGYRAWLRARVPEGGRLGIYGFGASAHLTAQVAIAHGATVHVRTRSERARRLALELGATTALGSDEPVVELLDSAVLFAPAGELVPVALEALDRGGTAAIAGIHLTDVPRLNYQRHLFYERNLCSVTANTRQDGRDFLRFAAQHPMRVRTSVYPFEEADRALADLEADRVDGAAVLRVRS